MEQGSKNHELVPLTLIAQISGARGGGVNKALGELAKRKLVGKVQNAKCMSLPPQNYSYFASSFRGVSVGFFGSARSLFDVTWVL